MSCRPGFQISGSFATPLDLQVWRTTFRQRSSKPVVHVSLTFLYQTDEIQNARRQRQLRVNSFARIEKQFSEEGRPSLRVEDLGDASELLQNNAYLGKTALQLIQVGVTRVERTWGGCWDNTKTPLRRISPKQDSENMTVERAGSHVEIDFSPF